MDIVDILVARALTPQGQIDTYAERARQAIINANSAVSSAEDAVSNIESITEQTNTNNETALESATAANQALEDANAAIELAYDALAQIDSATISTLDTEIRKLVHGLLKHTTEDAIYYDFTTTYPDSTVTTLNNLVRYYTTTGDNTDGTMTQKAISSELNRLEDLIDQQDFPSFEPINAGQLVVVGPDGVIDTSELKETDLIEALAKIGIYTAKEAVGITIDYENRAIGRIQDAENYSAGTDFDKYPMYGGRKRCNVNSNGEIVAWYGDSNFKDDGSNGDVMIYQPKFYYQRIPLKLEDNIIGKLVRKESISISAIEQSGFKIHPAFVNENNQILEYILLPAYESCYYSVAQGVIVKDDSGLINMANDSLRSCADAKPLSGTNSEFTIGNAEKMARNHGTGWHITNAAAESVNQLLEIIEFGTLNGQNALEEGISRITDIANTNCASQTGSTSSLGNTTGVAASTTNITNNVTHVYSTEGYRAISYRGMENPWGNMWRYVGGVNVYGNGGNAGGVPYICKNFNYNTSQIDDNYESAGFCLPSSYGWISAMAYGNEKYDWLLMPGECAGANSALPVGDSIWTVANLNGVNNVIIGGLWRYQQNNGLFCYGFDNSIGSNYQTINARIMHIPTYNSAVYLANIAAWHEKMEV